MIQGSGNFKRSLQKLSDNLRALGGHHDVPVTELFNADFMRRYAKVPTLEALLDAGGFKVETADDFKAIPNEEMDRAVREHTSFATWKEMFEKAGLEHMKRKLMDGVGR